jgi:CRP/FNR family cyclic AMP-dependent transcriptional regulator
VASGRALGACGRDWVTVPLPLTHALLAKLVGAARPSVTTALGRLAARSDLVRSDGRWLLNPASRASVRSLTE